MKVLLLTNLFPSEREPTRGVFSRSRFQALARFCDEARVVSPVPWWQRAKGHVGELWRSPRETHDNLEVVYPSYWSVPGRTSLHGRGLYLSLRPYLKKLRREFPFDVIMCAWAYPDGYAAARLARDFDCPLVTMVLGSDVNEFAQNPSLRPQIQWGLQQAHRVIAVSGALRDRVVELGVPAERVVVQHNGANGEMFALRDRKQVRARLGLPLDSPLLCYVGNFKPEKGVDVLIEAMGRLSHAGKREVTLALVGGGPLEETLRARVKELQIEEQVRFCGRQPHSDIPLWISAGDALCLPSHREGCPNVVLEALASGRPVIASRVGGVPELLSSDTGIMVPAGDADALAGGINEMLARTWDPCALRASVRCLSWDDVGRAYYSVLKEVTPVNGLNLNRFISEATCSP